MYNRQSIPPQVPNELKHQDSVFNKMNGSGKKSSNNKISIYSKRSTNNNSPNKKSTNNSIHLPTKNQFKFLQGSNHLQSSEKHQTMPINIQLRKINTFKQERKVQLHKQHSQQVQNNYFYSQNSQNLKKQEPLSQLRARQTESQANQSSFDISFVIGGSSQLNLQSNSKFAVKPQIMMANMIKLMQQQILIAKNAYYQKTNQTLRTNAKLIQEVNNKLIKNQQMLKKKDKQITDLKNKLSSKEIESSPKKSTSSSKSNSFSNQLPPSIPKNKKEQQLFLHKKVTDLQRQILMIAENSNNQNLITKVNNKISLIQNGLLKYFSAKFNVLDQKLSNFIKLKQQKMNNLQQNLKKLEYGMSKNSVKQIQKIQLKMRQIAKEAEEMKSEQNIFKNKEFKYQNFKIVQFQREIKELKSQIRQIQGIQFQNQKLFRILQELNKPNQNKFNIVQSYKPKFINQDQGEKTVYRNVFLNNNAQYSRQNPNFTEDSIISMNFSQTQQSLYSCQNKNMENAFSKLIKITDMKETNAPTQNSPFLNKQYFIPNKAPLLQKNEVQSRIQSFQRLNPNAQKKIQLLTPKKPSTNTLIYHKDHSNSFWSISQLQDVVDSTPNNQQVNDFDDDEFYYPLQESKSRLFASRLSKNNSSQFGSPNSQKKQNFGPGTNSQNNIFGLGSKKQSHLYHLNDQYENFSQQQEDDYKQTLKQQKFNRYTQKLTQNQQNLIQLIKSQKCETPLKVKFDKRGFMIIKSVNDKNQKLNGKQIKMQLQQVQRLSQMGLVTILSVY